MKSKQSCVSTAVLGAGDRARPSLGIGLAVGHYRQQSAILGDEVGGTSPTAAASQVAGRAVPQRLSESTTSRSFVAWCIQMQT